nr:MAG TPA: hypothetical protein [Caudoviricetes sp.]
MSEFPYRYCGLRKSTISDREICRQSAATIHKLRVRVAFFS